MTKGTSMFMMIEKTITSLSLYGGKGGWKVKRRKKEGRYLRRGILSYSSKFSADDDSARIIYVDKRKISAAVEKQVLKALTKISEEEVKGRKANRSKNNTYLQCFPRSSKGWKQ